MSSSRLNVGKLETSTASVSDAGVLSAGAVEPVDVAVGSSDDEHAATKSASAAITTQRLHMPEGDTPWGSQGVGSPPIAPLRSLCQHLAVGAEHRVATSALEDARRSFVDNVGNLSLEEALDAGGGYRSVLGLMKHTAGWSQVYHSFAFDPEPRRWDDADWPRGLRERVEPSKDYVDEVLAWFERSAGRWLAAVAEPVDLDEPRPVHWGDRLLLREIVAMVAGHWQYHAGEINAILAIRRGEAWEVGEAVEENHISTVGHTVRREWISDEDAERHEERLRELAREHGRG